MIDVVQVVFNGLLRDKKSFGDLLVGQTPQGMDHDFPLFWSQT